jgi:hypothetical protein
MKNDIIAEARRMGIRAKAETVVSAYVTPTLGNLMLIEGPAGRIRLSSDGRRCLAAYENSDENGFKLRFGLQLILLDSQTAQLIPYMLAHHNSNTTAVTVLELKKELQVLGVKGADKTTPVSSWMDFLEYVDLIFSVGSRKYILSSQYRAMRNGEPKVSEAVFMNALRTSYESLLPNTYGSPYVPIPDLREHVCRKLGISSFGFNRLLVDLAFSKQDIDSVRIVLATPMRYKPYGLRVGRKYYYFVSMFKR